MNGILELKTGEKGDESGNDDEAADDEGWELWNEAGVDIGYENRDKEEDGDDDEN